MESHRDASWREFRDDDVGYQDWISRHPFGFVLNARREPDPHYLVLHRVACASISRLQTQASTFMGNYMKVCADRSDELAEWALTTTGGHVQDCGNCRPRLQSPKSATKQFASEKERGGTIWDLMAVAVTELHEPFGRQDVLRWFEVNHPQINPSSVSTHLQLATSNAPAESRGVFASRTPLVTRVSRGKYVAFESAADPFRYLESAADLGDQASLEPPADEPAGATLTATYDIVLVGCAKAKRDSPGPAADLYTSRGFANRRAIANQAGRVWFILSAEHGLVAPDEWLAPYDLYLNDTSSQYRRAWGQWVVARLQRKLGSLNGRTVLVLAPAAYAEAIHEPLSNAGANVSEPLKGLAQGEQGAWLAGEARRRGAVSAAEMQSPVIPAAIVQPEGHGPHAPEDVAAALLAYREGNENLHESRLGYAETAEGDALLKSDPFAFLIGVVLDEGIKAERAWQGPLELKRRLGHLDPWRLRDQLEDVQAAVAARPALHRYVEIMARSIALAAARVCEEYGGDASQIWTPGSSAAEVDARLQRFNRIGPKKAAMAVELLVSHFGVELAGLTGGNIAYDVHVRRVFLRAGLVDVDNIDAIRSAARQLNPDRPGLLDLPTWLVGRGWCHASVPDCPSCPIHEACPQLVTRQVRSG